MTPFEQEYRWHQQQARLSREDNKTDSGIPLSALPNCRTARIPGPEVDTLSRDFLESMSKEQLMAVAQELYQDCNRLRGELHVLMAVDPNYKEP
jgi:hypothetical protein